MNTRDRRAIGLGLLVVLTAWTSLKGMPAAVRWLAREEEAVLQRAELLARAEIRVSDLGTLADSIDAYGEVASALPRLLLVGEDGTTAAVDLRDRIRRHMGTTSITTLGFPARQDGGRYGPLGLTLMTVRVETDFRGLLQAVGRIEADSALGVERLAVSAVEPDSAVDMERLQAEITVGGFFRPRAEDEAATRAGGGA